MITRVNECFRRTGRIGTHLFRGPRSLLHHQRPLRVPQLLQTIATLAPWLHSLYQSLPPALGHPLPAVLCLHPFDGHPRTLSRCRLQLPWRWSSAALVQPWLSCWRWWVSVVQTGNDAVPGCCPALGPGNEDTR